MATRNLLLPAICRMTSPSWTFALVTPGGIFGFNEPALRRRRAGRSGA